MTTNVEVSGERSHARCQLEAGRDLLIEQEGQQDEGPVLYVSQHHNILGGVPDWWVAPDM